MRLLLLIAVLAASAAYAAGLQPPDCAPYPVYCPGSDEMCTFDSVSCSFDCSTCGQGPIFPGG